MKVIFVLLNAATLMWLAYQVWKGSEQHLKKVYWPAIAVKLIAGIAVGLVYARYYNGAGDTWRYFEEGSALARIASDNPVAYFKFLITSTTDIKSLSNLSYYEPRALLFSKIVSLFCYLTYNSYWVVALYFSFFSFLGSWFLVRKISLYFHSLWLPAAIAFLFFPSVVFWSAGIIKESLAMAALFFLSAIFLTLWFPTRVRLIDWLLVIFCTWLLWSLKYYFAAVFFSVAITALIYRFLLLRLFRPKTFTAEVLLWAGIFLMPIAFFSFTHPNFYVSRVLNVIVENYNAFYAVSAEEDLILFETLKPTAWSVLTNAPEALFSGLFRPLLWEAGNFFQFLIATENSLLIVLTLIALAGTGTSFNAGYRMLIFSCMVYIALLAIFITLSTPNFGSLSRYRVAWLPYFVMLLLGSATARRFIQRYFNRLVQEET